MRQHDENWTAEFARLGHPGAEPLAAGMEGAVYRLGDGLVAKVWAHREAAGLAGLQRFYAELAGRGLGFRTPVIHEVHTTGLGPCTIEEELPGRPLAAAVPAGGPPGPEVVGTLLEVLGRLAAVPAPERLGRLPVLDESAPFRDGGTDWTGALIALIDRRLARFGHLLARQVPDLERKADRVRQLLRERTGFREGLLHGDLVSANVLVDQDLRPTAVLDFGFLSAPGDPAFDAAVAASIADMYGPGARATEALLDDALVTRFGYPREVLLLYRAAYALVTGNAYDPTGADGHFRWCVRMLNRDDVTDLLARGPGPS